ncbi:MAG: hypothetical protein N3G22_04750 [Candidatus Micrarchaeota archaeon]|nr:hypothetical protein [Candidatus Micrarchaeota archaeon]
MDGQQERTIIISSRELVEHTVLSRRKNELAFKRDFLLRTGAKPDDLHVKSICEELAHVEAKLAPIAEKLEIADMISVVPRRKEISELTEKINKYSRGELDLAVREKRGEAYELMKKRAVLVRENFDRREDIARMTIFLNTLPRKDGEALASLIEEGQGPDVDVSFLPKEKQQELVNLAARLGRQCCVYAGSFSLDKKKVELAEIKAREEVLKTVLGGKRIWVSADRISEFEENEKRIAELLAKIQAKGTEKQARKLSEEEAANFDRMQTDYLSALQKRAEFAKGMELSETAKVYKKGAWKKLDEAY